MKLNKILMALSAMAIVGCSSEDFDVPSATQAIDDSRLVQLDESFVLAGVGVEGSTTRTHWEQDAETGAYVNKFLPIFNASGSTKLDEAANLDAQAVGLCWLGQGAVGTDVYTNYQFYHFGWLKKGETEADVDNCVPAKLYNGALYDEITLGTAGTLDKEADETDFTITTTSKASWGAASTALNYNSGVYMTKNKSIFGGQYIVYYPYNEDFKDAGTIPAAAKTNWAAPVDDGTAKGWMAPEIGKETFRYSAPVTIEGGNKAANFGLYNLSAIVQLRVASVADELTGAQIDQIVLYSASEKLLKKAYLAADKIKDGAKGAGLYASTEGTKTIVANPTTNITIDAQGKPDRSAYITVLPTTVDDLVALVHKTDGRWAQISLGNKEFKAGSAKRLDIVVKAADFTTDFIAVDEASLTNSLKAARTAAGSAPYTPQTITVIGDITLKAATTNGITVSTVGTYEINHAEDAAITIKGDDIIVPEKVTLNLKTNMESDVRVLGTYCCGGATIGGRVDVKGGTISNVTLEPSEARVTADTYDNLNPQITYSAAATVAAGKTVKVQAGNVEVNAAVQHKGDIVIAEGAKVTVKGTTGDLNFMGSYVTNNGTIEVEKAGKFDMTDANGNAHASDGERMTNNKTGKFIHNVDAGVGTAVQSMNQNGEYRCKVDKQEKLNDAFLQWTACSVIEMVNPSTVMYNLGTAASIPTKADGTGAYKHKGKYIDIEVNSGAITSFNNPGATNGDSEEIHIGNLTVTRGGLNVDYVQGTGKRMLTVHGNMEVNAETKLWDSKKITVDGNLTVNGATLLYKGAKANVDGLEVKKDITVSGAAGLFDAHEDNAIKIKCANFYLTDKATATFGNRTGEIDKTMAVTGTISNPKDCTFGITAATDPNLLAWITCTELLVGGNWTGARPIVE